MREHAAAFGDAGGLVGVMTEAATSAASADRPTAVILNSGVIHRVGSNRLGVRLARMLAANGVPTLRFDLSGIGDSASGADRSSLVDRWVADTRAAMAMLADRWGADRFLLIGNCSGAAIAYFTAHADARVAGIVAMNPQVPQLGRYYLRLALTNPKTWRRMLSVAANPGRVVGSLRSRQKNGAADAPETQLDIVAGLDTLARRGVEILIVASEWDPSYDYFGRTVRRQLGRPPLRERIRLATVPRTNHDFSVLASQEQLIRIVDAWSTRAGPEPLP